MLFENLRQGWLLRSNHHLLQSCSETRPSSGNDNPSQSAKPVFTRRASKTLPENKVGKLLHTPSRLWLSQRIPAVLFSTRCLPKQTAGKRNQRIGGCQHRLNQPSLRQYAPADWPRIDRVAAATSDDSETLHGLEELQRWPPSTDHEFLARQCDA